MPALTDLPQCSSHREAGVSRKCGREKVSPHTMEANRNRLSGGASAGGIDFERLNGCSDTLPLPALPTHIHTQTAPAHIQPYH